MSRPVIHWCAWLAVLALAAPWASADDGPTFSRDVAPLVFKHCAECHRPGGAGPFSLLTYDDVRRHLKQAVRAVTSRMMPPWLPEAGFGEFVGDRHLDEATIALFQRWAEQGAVEGNLADLPKPPVVVTGDWALGKPDLILKLSKAYTLGGEGTDLYRNFVFPTGLEAKRFVRAVELRSGNPRVVHHANLFLDRTGAARRRSDKAEGNGYDSMDPGDDVTRPEGSDLNWRPGRAGHIASDDSPWTLPADADVVLQTHLRRQGKPEALQPEIGLYFTDKRPTALVARLTLRAGTIDIPAGEEHHVEETKYTLPVDAEALGVFAHAHYLGREVHGWAILPDGRRVELLKITRWNFNMQDSYAYRQPVKLPKGATVYMRWVYDNSAKNPVNPNAPPKRVFAGENTTDEMGELWVQLRMKDQADYDRFNADYAEKWAWPDAVQSLEARIKRTPNDATLHVDLAKLMLVAARTADAVKELEAALRIDPKCAAAHYVMGHILIGQREMGRATESLRKSVEAEPDNFKARGDLALILAMTGDTGTSVSEFGAALKLNPRDVLTHVNLGRVLALQGKAAEARAEVEAALKLDPDDAMARAVMKELDGARRP